MSGHITRQPISSSNIASIGYVPDSRVLEVEFNSGHVYHYRNVAPHHFDELLRTQSPGGYLHQHIKGAHEYERIHPAKES